MANYSSQQGGGRRGFAAMEPEQRRQIASRGGRMSHRSQDEDWDENEQNDERSYRTSGRNRDDDDYSSYGSEGGGDYAPRYSSGRDYDEDEGYYDDDEGSRRGRGRQGFASMDEDEQRRIASMGGRASHGGGRSQSRLRRGRGLFERR